MMSWGKEHFSVLLMGRRLVFSLLTMSGRYTDCIYLPASIQFRFGGERRTIFYNAT